MALLTDGRMSGASGSIPAAIHVAPEAVHAGPVSRIQDGDLVRLDSATGTLDVHLAPEDLSGRRAVVDDTTTTTGTGREMFRAMRVSVGRADEGASVFGELGINHGIAPPAPVGATTVPGGAE